MLLQTKFYRPTLRPDLIPRELLYERLQTGLWTGHTFTRKLTLITAPAGYGKTTLVAGWIENWKTIDSQIDDSGMTKPAICWLSLDAYDNDPIRFWTYVVTTLQKEQCDVGGALLTILQTVPLPSSDVMLTTLINDIYINAVPIMLILDDYHLIHTQAIHEALAFLIENLTPQLHLVLVTRVDPPLNLASLRIRRQMTELRAADLRFTPDEVAQFLTAVMGLSLTQDNIATLEARTEGWIAGLQVAAMALQGQSNAEQFITSFTGSHRHILSYLVEEVLQRQPIRIQTFLLQTAILDQMTGDLCNALTGEQTGHAILEELEAINLFVIPLDDERRWYRYHHLFADLLKHTLQQRYSKAEIRELHHRASCWHQVEGSLEEAMRHAMAAQDFERAILMIDENIARMLSRSETPVLLGWIEKIPEKIVRGHPWIDVNRAYTLALSGQLELLDPLLEDLEKQIEPGTPRASELLGHITAIRAYTANLHGDAARAIEMAVLTESYLPDKHLNARAMAAYALAETHFAGDDMERASEASLKMLKAGEQVGRLIIVVPAMCNLAAIKKVQGRLNQAEQYYIRTREWMVERNALDSRVRCPYEIGLADLLREWNQLDAAYAHTLTGIEYTQRFGVYGILVSGYITLMRICQAQGNVNEALNALHNAERIMETQYHRLAVRIEYNTARVTQWLAVGDVEMANRCTAEFGNSSEPEQIAMARLWLAQGRAVDAQGLLERQSALAEAGGRIGRLIEILSLQALSLAAQDQVVEAHAVLYQALSLARPKKYARVFLDLGPPLYELLEKSISMSTLTTAYSTDITRITETYVLGLLDVFREESAARRNRLLAEVSEPFSLYQASQDPLTDREREVLRLLVEGLSNKKIAEKLYIAPSTVKQHLKNIYSKLDVHSRTQAVARGLDLGLF